MAYENPRQPSEQSEPQEQSAESLVQRLANSIVNLRTAATELGMLENKVFYNLYLANSEELRICGAPTLFKDPETDDLDPYLLVTTNRIQISPPGSRPDEIFTEEYVVGNYNLWVVSDFLAPTRGFQFDQENQPPVIWKTTTGEWDIFRGRQDFKIPHFPHVEHGNGQLESWLAESQDLAALLGHLTPGCEDARYKIKMS